MTSRDDGASVGNKEDGIDFGDDLDGGASSAWVWVAHK
jgi:hypothetical protein